MAPGSTMSFFESFPDPPPPPPRGLTLRSPWLASETVIPGSVPGELLLVHTDAIAVAIGSLRAFPNGLEFTVHVRLRRVDEASPYGLYDPFSNHDPGSRGRGEQQVRLGVLFADGRRAVKQSGWRSERDYSEYGETSFSWPAAAPSPSLAGGPNGTTASRASRCCRRRAAGAATSAGTATSG